MTARRRRGATMLELVVALVITAAMAAIGSSAMATLLDQQRVIAAAAVETERAASLRTLLHEWVDGGVIDTRATSTPERAARTRQTGRGSSALTARDSIGGVTAAAVTGDELLFSTDALTPAGSLNTLVRLYVDGDAETPEQGLTIEYRASATSPLARVQLDSLIRSMRVDYLDTLAQTWISRDEARGRRVVAARLTFAELDDDRDGLLQLPLLFPIRQGTALLERVELQVLPQTGGDRGRVGGTARGVSRPRGAPTPRAPRAPRAPR